MASFRVQLPRIRTPDPAAVVRAAAGVLFEAGQEIVGLSRKEEVPVNDGALRATIQATPPHLDRGRVTVTVFAGGPAAPYALHVHEGTRPRRETGARPPPIGPLKRWAAKKLGDENLAYAVRQKIIDKGTEPTKFLERPFLAVKPLIKPRLARALAELARKGTLLGRLKTFFGR